MKIILCGACGKMGKSVASLVNAPDTVVCGIDFVQGEAPFPVYLTCEEVTEQADVMIDFSSPLGLEERLAFCERENMPLVLATTGFSAEDTEKIVYYARHNTIFRAENFSFGANLLRFLARKAAKVLQNYDIEIVEKHHSQKQDAPSGTALSLAKSINESLGNKKRPVFCRSGKRQTEEIGIHSVRGGTVTGEHEIYFFGEYETLTLSHSAQNRSIFAAGALKAAAWLIDKPAGLYCMDDMCADLLDK